MRIDAHQHFWKFNATRNEWITEEMLIIRRDFMPSDLEPILKKNRIDGCVVVQSSQSEEENVFQQHNADKFDFIKGIVGWVDLLQTKIAERLEYYSSVEKIKGFRHTLQGEADRAIMLKPAFKNGIKELGKYGFTYDLLILPDQLAYAYELAKNFPHQKFIIDHLAKPNIRDGEITNWKKEIACIAQCPNVYCKVSGIITEANLTAWKYEDLLPYIDVIVECFGIDRIIYGSDWPVCLLAGTYEQVIDVVNSYFSSFTKNEQAKFFGLNAINFYNLNV